MPKTPCVIDVLGFDLVHRFRHYRISSAHPRKNALSGTLYLLSVPLAYVSIYASFIFALIPAMYFLPEKELAGDE